MFVSAPFRLVRYQSVCISLPGNALTEPHQRQRSLRSFDDRRL